MSPDYVELVWTFLFLYLKLWSDGIAPSLGPQFTGLLLWKLSTREQAAVCWSTRRLSVAFVNTSYFAIIFKLRLGTMIPLIISSYPTYSHHSWHRVGAQSLFWVNERRNRDHPGSWSQQTHRSIDLWTGYREEFPVSFAVATSAISQVPHWWPRWNPSDHLSSPIFSANPVSYSLYHTHLFSAFQFPNNILCLLKSTVYDELAFI